MTNFLTSIYSLFAIIDYALYNIAAVIFRIIIAISKADFFTSKQIDGVVGRVYIVIGVLVLFKLVISAIQYMINPDTFDDKEKGMANILKKVIISIALVVLAPVVFNFLIFMQGYVVGTIPNIVFGDKVPTDKDVNDMGEQLSFTVLSSFVEAKKDKGGSVGSGASNGIHDIDSFKDKILDGCQDRFTILAIDWDEVLGAKKPMENCKYNYTIILSTIAGGFLCYVLLSMILDVSIRTIKFGIIRMLAPIPIVGYIFSKEKLNKFVKTVSTVYADLFIRIAIIYFIIFFIQNIFGVGGDKRNILDILNITGGGNSNSDIFLNIICNIAIIFGLLMFAKNAPKFISELLGLPDIGAGDMADMFKPAWQRAGGAAGQIINPFTTAAANYRQAHRENGRTIGESLRRAAGGFGKGAIDSVQGMMAGDDWAKMRNRHDAAVKKSGQRTLRQIKKETDRTVNERKLSRLRSAMSQLGSAIGLDSRYEQQATSDYNNYLNGLNNRMNSLKSEINSGTISDSDRRLKVQELNDLQNEYSSITSVDGRKDWIKNALYYRNAEAAQNARLTAINNQIGANRTRVQAINNRIASGVSDDERARLELEKNSLLNQSKELANESRNITTDSQVDINNRIEEYKKHNQEIEDKRKDYQKQISIIEEAVNEPIHGNVFNSIDTYFGGPGSQGKTYISFAETLGKNRGSIYTGEAMDKMKKNADILVDENGDAIKYKTAFCTKPGQDFSYEEITRIFSEFKAGQIKPEDLVSDYGLNAATLDSAFQEIEKYAARDYLNANIIAADGDRLVIDKNGNQVTLADSIAQETGHRVKLKRGSPNTTVVEWWDRFESDILASGLSRDEARKYHDEFLRNPGKFIAGASDLKERLITRGTRIVDAQNPKDGK